LNPIGCGWRIHKRLFHERLSGLLSVCRFAVYGACGHPQQKILGQDREMA
jgi:hypothetical protein